MVFVKPCVRMSAVCPRRQCWRDASRKCHVPPCHSILCPKRKMDRVQSLYVVYTFFIRFYRFFNPFLCFSLQTGLHRISWGKQLVVLMSLIVEKFQPVDPVQCTAKHLSLWDRHHRHSVRSPTPIRTKCFLDFENVLSGFAFCCSLMWW